MFDHFSREHTVIPFCSHPLRRPAERMRAGDIPGRRHPGAAPPLTRVITAMNRCAISGCPSRGKRGRVASVRRVVSESRARLKLAHLRMSAGSTADRQRKDAEAPEKPELLPSFGTDSRFVGATHR
jgi:hypothetical protein